MRASFEHGFETRGQGEDALARTRAAAEADDADLFVDEHVDGDVLLRRAAAQVEHGLVRAYEGQTFVGMHAGERGLRAGGQRDTGGTRQVARCGDAEEPVL